MTLTAPPGRPLVECQALSKRYCLGGQVVHALEEVSFRIDAGELVAITGPSGSGKSTLMHLLGALDTPSAGHLSLAGTDIAHLDPDQLADLRNRAIGFVFQQFNLLARTSALDNVRLPLDYARPPHPDPTGAALGRLREVGLEERLHHQPSQLSGGQQQRVAIARALVNDPALLLADEPTGALDSVTSAEILGLFRRINETGTTVILVTHDPEVAAWAAREIRLRDGRIVADLRRDPPPREASP